jgi:alginate O-acetyltransferase complex protein AlgI
MTFNSTAFLIFLMVFVALLGACRQRRMWRNRLIVLASYIFYGWWDWRFTGLLLFTSMVDFAAGIAIQESKSPGRKRLWLVASILSNLGVLGFFKYAGFFRDSVAAASAALGWTLPPLTLEVLLPAGISFYTFQSLSYVIDVYRGDIPAAREPTEFLAFVSFFPQLVAGPIERASHLLPQFQSARLITREAVAEGLWLVVWGMFKKVVVADNLAPFAELAFDARSAGAAVTALGVLAFAVQIYADFSGYSDIARGVARWLGFDLMVNFTWPWAATTPQEFWRCWHISLSTWLRDYLYRPLGGNRSGLARTAMNLALTMVLAGLWHGAAWTFVIWGLWHGAGLVLHRLWSELKGPSVPAPIAWFATQTFVALGWIWFRASSFPDAIRLFQELGRMESPPWVWNHAWGVLAWSLALGVVDAWQRWHRDPLRALKLAPVARWGLQTVLLAAVVCFWQKDSTPFIYFRF